MTRLIFSGRGEIIDACEIIKLFVNLIYVN